MYLYFRQGTVQGNSFLSRSGLNISLIASSTPTFTAAHYSANYLIQERSAVPNAWAVADLVANFYLYIDIDVNTGARTFGTSTVAPVYGPTEPVSPVNDLHWFDTVNQITRVYSSATSKFITKIRVFVGNCNAGVLVYKNIGTHVGITSARQEFNTAAIVYDSTGNAILTSDRTFLTEGSQIIVTNAFSGSLTLQSQSLSLVAGENLVTGNIIYVDDNNTATLAQYEDTFNKFTAIVLYDADTGEQVKAAPQGLISNTAWDWSALTPGDMLWIDNGVLVSTNPYESNPLLTIQPAVARVVDKQSVWFEHGMGSTPHTHNAKDIMLDVNIGAATNVSAGLTYLNSDKLSTAGGTMTGALILAGSPLTALHAVNKAYVDAITIERLSNVITEDLQPGDVLTYNGSFWVNNKPVPLEEDKYVVIQVDTDVISDGVVFDVNDNFLKLNLDSNSLQGDIIANNYVGPIDITLTGFVEDKPYSCTIIADHVGTSGDVFASYTFNQIILWKDGVAPTALPSPYYSLVINLIILPVGTGSPTPSEYNIYGEWGWHIDQYGIDNTQLGPIVFSGQGITFTNNNLAAGGKIVQLSDGTILAFFLEYDTSEDQEFKGIIGAKRSFDGGKSWETVGEVLRETDSTPNLKAFRDYEVTIHDDVIHLAMVCHNAADGVADVIYKKSTSTAGSMSWTATSIIDSFVVPSLTTWQTDLLHYNDEVYIVTNNPETADWSELRIYKSLDTGNSWNVVTTKIDAGPDIGKGGTQSAIAPNGDIFIISGYTQYRTPTTLFVDALPHGTNVLVAKGTITNPVIEPGTEIAVGAITVAQDGKIHAVYTCARTDLQPKYELTSLHHVYSADEGATWNGFQPIFRLPTDTTYIQQVEIASTIVVQDNNTIHVNALALSFRAGQTDPILNSLYSNSDDLGATWTLQKNIFLGSVANIGSLYALFTIIYVDANISLRGKLDASDNMIVSNTTISDATGLTQTAFSKFVNRVGPVAPPAPEPLPLLPSARITTQVGNHEVPPANVKHPDGTLFCFVGEYVNYPTNYRTALRCHKSTDDGVTWQYVSTIFENANEEVGSIATAISTGPNRIHVVYGKDPTGGIDAAPVDPNAESLWHVYSDDLGVTWSPEHSILGGDGDVYWNDINLLITPDNSMHLVTNCSEDGGANLRLRYLFNSNLGSPYQWEDRGFLTPANGSTMYYSKISSGLDENSELFIIYNDIGVANYANIIRSYDAGVTWTVPYLIPANLHPMGTDNGSYGKSPYDIKYASIAAVPRIHALYGAALEEMDIPNYDRTTLTNQKPSVFYVSAPHAGSPLVWDKLSFPFYEPSTIMTGVVTEFSFLSAKMLIDSNSRIHVVGYVQYQGPGGKVQVIVLYTNSDDGGTTWGQQLEQQLDPAHQLCGGGFDFPQSVTFVFDTFNISFDRYEDIIVTYSEPLTADLAIHTCRIRFPNKKLPQADIPSYGYCSMPTDPVVLTPDITLAGSPGLTDSASITIEEKCVPFVIDIDPSTTEGSFAWEFITTDAALIRYEIFNAAGDSMYAQPYLEPPGETPLAFNFTAPDLPLRVVVVGGIGIMSSGIGSPTFGLVDFEYTITP